MFLNPTNTCCVIYDIFSNFGRKLLYYPCPLSLAVFQLLGQNCHKLANQQLQQLLTIVSKYWLLYLNTDYSFQTLIKVSECLLLCPNTDYSVCILTTVFKHWIKCPITDYLVQILRAVFKYWFKCLRTDYRVQVLTTVFKYWLGVWILTIVS